MFTKVLVANRGEIAVRVMRACRELGVRTVAVFSDADRDALHVRYADEAYPIGPPEPARSYLDMDAIVDAVRRSGADAVHPGYGFLSENARFAARCEREGIVFIGPPASAIAAMGDKVEARRLMKAAGVPLVPGSEAAVGSAGAVRRMAASIGFPLLLKAAAGGGGRGMRVVREASEIDSAFGQASSEAGSAFGDPSVYVERCIERGRHIEVQVLADPLRPAVHLGERECSIQRRHQKLIEECPSPMVDPRQREELGAAALRAAEAVGYRGAGTVEFLVDREGRFYFMEMNTRLQVEHPVTEMVTGVDLVKAQLRIAAGEDSGVRQEDIAWRGSSIECRIIAEDPDRNFMPCPGRIEHLRSPGGPGVRVDGGAYEGYVMPLHYDSLISKLVVWGATREEAIARMLRALDEYLIEGVPTTIGFHQRALRDGRFVRGELHTGFVQEMEPAGHSAGGLLADAVRTGPAGAPAAGASGRGVGARGRRETAPGELEDLAVIAAALAMQGRSSPPGASNGAPAQGALWKLAGRRRNLEGRLR